MAKKIIEVDDKKKPKVNLNKIKDVIIDNKDTIIKMMDIAEDFFDDEDDKKAKKKTSKTAKKTSSKVTSKKSSSKSTSKKKGAKSTKSNSDLATVIDIAGKLFK